MAKKSVILWVTDGVGWGFDIRAKAVSKLLPQYQHVIFTSRNVTIREILGRIKSENPDIIMAMSPMLLPYLHDYRNKVIATLPSHRSLNGW